MTYCYEFCFWNIPTFPTFYIENLGAQWLSGRVLDSRPKGRRFEPHWRHCLVSLSKNINPSLVLVQPRETRPFITERLLMGRKESNQTNKNIDNSYYLTTFSKLVCSIFQLFCRRALESLRYKFDTYILHTMISSKPQSLYVSTHLCFDIW